MRILIDIGHPGHVHLFRPFVLEMQKRGHQILFTCREKEFEIELLKAANFDFVSFGKKYNSTTGKIFGLLKFDFLEVIQAIKFKPDLFLSHGSPYAAHAAAILRKIHISLEDTGNKEQIKLYLPFTKHVLTPSVLRQSLGDKQIRYNGYHELAYLHPKQFKVEKDVYELLNLETHEKFVILRLVSWNASHDKGQSGFSETNKEEIINYLKDKYRVFISSEGKLPQKYEKYLIKITPENMHTVLAGASMFIGEGATMASEAGVLGTPAIYVNSLISAYNEDQEYYGLVSNFRNGNGVVAKIKELESIPNIAQVFKAKRARLLADKIDVTAFLVWFIEEYPTSAKTMKENPDYQYFFR
jgi:predicted glycosyltransferase